MATTMTPPAPQKQAPIQTPPRVITTKDLLYVKDVLSWELDAFKKFHHSSRHGQGAIIKQSLHKAGQGHQRQCNKQLTQPQVDNNAAMASLPKQPDQQGQ